MRNKEDDRCECVKRQWTPEEWEKAIVHFGVDRERVDRCVLLEWGKVYSHRPNCPKFEEKKFQLRMF